MVNSEYLRGQKVILRDKRLVDALDEYIWQRDAELAWLNANEPISITFNEFLPCYAEKITRRSKRERAFAIDTLDHMHIGNCTYYDANLLDKEVNIGIIIGNRQYWGKGYGSDAVKTLLNHIFNFVGLERVFLRTLECNVRAIKCFENCGFVAGNNSIKQGKGFIKMEFNPKSLPDKSQAKPKGTSE